MQDTCRMLQSLRCRNVQHVLPGEGFLIRFFRVCSYLRITLGACSSLKFSCICGQFTFPVYTSPALELSSFPSPWIHHIFSLWNHKQHPCMTGSSVSHQCFCSPIPACVCLDYTCLGVFPWASSPWLKPCMISPVLLSILKVTLGTSLNLICFSHDLTCCLPWAPLPVTYHYIWFFLLLCFCQLLSYQLVMLSFQGQFFIFLDFFLYCCTHPPSVTPSLKYKYFIMISEKLFFCLLVQFYQIV